MDFVWPEPIPEPEPVVLKKRTRSKRHCKKHIEAKLGKLSVSNANLQKFSNLPIVLSLFFMYLFKKYKSGCVLMYGNAQGLQVKLSHPEMNMTRYNEISMGIVKCVRKGTKIIVIPFMLYGFVHLKDPSSGHANVLIYRSENNVLEHFEPHGSYYQPTLKTDHDRDLIKKELNIFVNRLNTIMTGLGLPETKLIESRFVFPHLIGLQALESSIPNKQETIGGYCAAWSMFFTELVLANPALSSQKILEIVFMKAGGMHGGQYLKDVIEGYSNHISNKIDKYYSILFNQGMTTVEIQCRHDNSTAEELAKIDAEFQFIHDLEIELLTKNIPIKQKILSVTEEKNKYAHKVPPLMTKKLDILEKMNKLEELQTPDSSLESLSPSPKQNTKTLKKTASKHATTKRSPPAKVKICPEGSYLNVVTNRCNKYPNKYVKKTI